MFIASTIMLIVLVNMISDFLQMWCLFCLGVVSSRLRWSHVFKASIDVNRAIREMVQAMIIGYYVPTVVDVVIGVYEIGREQRCAKLVWLGKWEKTELICTIFTLFFLTLSLSSVLVYFEFFIWPSRFAFSLQFISSFFSFDFLKKASVYFRNYTFLCYLMTILTICHFY